MSTWVRCSSARYLCMCFFFCLFGGNCFLRLCCVFFEREVFEARRETLRTSKGLFCLAGALVVVVVVAVLLFRTQTKGGKPLENTTCAPFWRHASFRERSILFLREKSSLVLLHVPRAHLKRAFTNETALIRRRKQTRTRRSSRARRVRGGAVESLSPV